VRSSCWSYEGGSTSTRVVDGEELLKPKMKFTHVVDSSVVGGAGGAVMRRVMLIVEVLLLLRIA
jgi:hypothetical protein